MKSEWYNDIKKMHAHYKVYNWVKENKDDKELMNKYLGFRLDFLEEEMNELSQAYVNKDAEEVVDALIDLIVVALGTLDIFDVDVDKAWKEVLKANMNKVTGIKPERPNPFGLPDLIKPEGWQAPDHSDNHALIGKSLK